MSRPLPDGLYDRILTEELAFELSEFAGKGKHTLESLDAATATRRLAEALADQLANVLQDIGSSSIEATVDGGGKSTRLQSQLEFVNSMLVKIRSLASELHPERRYDDHIRLLAAPAQNLTAIHRQRTTPSAPDTGLMVPWLFTAAKGSPALLSELRHELASSNRIDILMSFITVSGIRKIRDILHSITAVDGTGNARTKLRIITTTYIGATEAAAVDELARLPCESLDF